MPKQYTEHAFETGIEQYLTTHGGYETGDRESFDPILGLFPQDAVAFIQKTQPKQWKYLEDIQNDKAARALARFMSLHPHNIAQKTEVMIEHFRHFTMHKIGGKAKAMVVTSSRLHAVRYKLAFDDYIAEKGYKGIKTLVAFQVLSRIPMFRGKTTLK